MIARVLSALMPRTTPARPSSYPGVPEGKLVYAIGDIHGRLDLLQSLQRSIAADAASNTGGDEKFLVYLGDYIDRGMQSRQLIDHLIDHPLAGFRSVFLTGNHEQVFLQFLVDPTIGPTWCAIGGRETVYSYGASVPSPSPTLQELEAVRLDIASRLPERHRDFFASLRMTFEIGDYLFVHAGIRPGKPIDQQDPRDLLWIRHHFLKSEQDHGKIIVHGHSISEGIDETWNRIGIDTGAFHSDILTCLILQGRTRRYIQTAPSADN